MPTRSGVHGAVGAQGGQHAVRGVWRQWTLRELRLPAAVARHQRRGRAPRPDLGLAVGRLDEDDAWLTDGAGLYLYASLAQPGPRPAISHASGSRCTIPVPWGPIGQVIHKTWNNMAPQ